jgi:hypothetical protein
VRLGVGVSMLPGRLSYSDTHGMGEVCLPFPRRPHVVWRKCLCVIQDVAVIAFAVAAGAMESPFNIQVVCLKFRFQGLVYYVCKGHLMSMCN